MVFWFHGRGWRFIGLFGWAKWSKKLRSCRGVWSGVVWLVGLVVGEGVAVLGFMGGSGGMAAPWVSHESVYLVGVLAARWVYKGFSMGSCYGHLAGTARRGYLSRLPMMVCRPEADGE